MRLSAAARAPSVLWKLPMRPWALLQPLATVRALRLWCSLRHYKDLNVAQASLKKRECFIINPIKKWPLEKPQQSTGGETGIRLFEIGWTIAFGVDSILIPLSNLGLGGCLTEHGVDLRSNRRNSSSWYMQNLIQSSFFVAAIHRETACGITYILAGSKMHHFTFLAMTNFCEQLMIFNRKNEIFAQCLSHYLQ